jgi:hypothetical protein
MRATWMFLVWIALSGCSDRPSPPLAIEFAPGCPEVGVESVKAAAEQWNTSLGSQLFYIAEPGDQPGCDRVHVRFIDAMPSAYPDLIGLFEQVGCHYQISILRDYARDQVNAAHELGHTLALGHSEDRESIMFHMAGRNARIQGEDVALVRKRWDL